MKKLILTLALTAVMAIGAQAVPNLQIYIPGATYDAGSETWVIGATDFEVWVVAANLNQGSIYDITLVAAIHNEDTPVDGALSITPHGGATTTYNAADWTYGTPPPLDPLPPHGVFPTNYVEHLVSTVTEQNALNWIEVQDYVPGGDGGTSMYGQIFKFNVHSSYDWVHFDGYGYYDDPDGKRIFAPFSHDGESGMVPEPASLLLMTLGLGGSAIIRKFRKA